MTDAEDIKRIISEIGQLNSDDKLHEKAPLFWYDNLARILIFIDDLVCKSEAVNVWLPKSLNKSTANFSIIELLFDFVEYVPNLNVVFKNDLWLSHLEQKAYSDNDATFDIAQYNVSVYETIYSRISSVFTQMLGDRFSYVQKILIKNIFQCDCPGRSVMASDLYVFLMRLLNKPQRAAMCQIIMNFCKVAPPNALVNGVALINRIKHPFINFESPLYQDILTKFSS